MKSITSSLFASFGLTVLFAGCQTSPTESSAGDAQTGVQAAARVVVKDSTCIDLLAGQTIPAGNVCSRVRGDSLQVTYNTSGGWALSEIHLWLDTSVASMPQTASGNPKLGLFPFAAGALAGATSHTVSIPLSRFGLSATQEVCQAVNLMVVAHAVVRRATSDSTFQTETAYGAGTRLVAKGNWATWFGLTLECVAPPRIWTFVDKGTAYAFLDGAKSTCLSDLDKKGNNWGWTSGPLVQGTYSLRLWRGAGQCDTTKGTLVGTVHIQYAGSVAKVTYMVDSPRFTLAATHLWVGTTPLPQTCVTTPKATTCSYTSAPGQFGNIHGTLSHTAIDTYTIATNGGAIHVAAHAEVEANALVSP